VRSEATLADRRHKLVPAIIEPCDRPIAFELTHTAEFTDWNGDRSDIRWRRFVEDLRRVMQSSDRHDVATRHDGKQPPRPTSPTADRTDAAARQPLRPGNDEIISADRPRVNGRAQQIPPVRSSVASEMHCLRVEDGELANQLLIIDSSSIKIGRSAPADIILSHKSLSREHCIVGVANDELLVTDLNSTNGSYIDDVRVSRATILPVGSVLRLGEIEMRHLVEAAIETERSSGESGLRPSRVPATF
jgi:hypothetical protein